jgi:hypothetical protein
MTNEELAKWLTENGYEPMILGNSRMVSKTELDQLDSYGKDSIINAEKQILIEGIFKAVGKLINVTKRKSEDGNIIISASLNIFVKLK